MTSKAQRQHQIGQLLEHEVVTSQSQLAELLSGKGITASEATVSRDLEELGAIKVRVPGGQTAYAIPEQPHDHHVPADTLQRVLGDWVVEVAHSANLVIVRTPPGSAHVVGSALDRAGLPGVLGTVAGDDTLMLVADEQAGGRAVAEKVREIAGLP